MNPANTMSVSASLTRRISPVPLGDSDRLSSETVVIVAAAPPPSERDVESIASDAAASIVASDPAVIVVRPAAVRLVSDAAIVSVFEPESRVRPFVVVASVAANHFQVLGL